MESNIKNILILDFCSEKNRGDAAMQVGTIKLIRKYFPADTNISVISVFGANQLEDVRPEYDHSLEMDIELLGGLKPTFYPLEQDNERSELFIELLNSLAFTLSILLLFLVSIKTPKTLINMLLPSRARQTFSSFLKADTVIWNGRNFRSRGNQLLEFYRTLHLVYHSLLAHALSKPIACIGASVWELRPMARSVLKLAFDNCYFISVREKRSYDVAKKVLGKDNEKKLYLLPDLSFAVFDDIDPSLQTKQFSDTDFPQKIGITIVDWQSDGKEIRTTYQRTIQETIQYFLEKGSQVFIIPQVVKKWEHFESLLEDIKAGLHTPEVEKITIIQGEPKVRDLLGIYAQLDFLVATRMHSAIFASVVQTPLIAISYDDGGKWSILEELGYSDFIIPYSKVSSSSLIELISSCWQQKDALLEKVHIHVSENIAQVNKNISLLPELYSSEDKTTPIG